MPEHLARSPLDEAIDSVVREMTQAEPLPGFDRRVRLRLGERPRQGSVAWPRLAASAAAVAAIVVLVLTFRPDPSGPAAPAERTVTTPPVARNVPEPPQIPTGSRERASTARRTARPVTPPAQSERTVSTASVEEEAVLEHTISPIPPLDTPAALMIETIEQRPITLQDITMSSINVRQLSVEALPVAEQRRKE